MSLNASWVGLNGGSKLYYSELYFCKVYPAYASYKRCAFILHHSKKSKNGPLWMAAVALASNHLDFLFDADDKLSGKYFGISI